MTTLPKTLKVGHLKYTIKLVPNGAIENAYGDCDPVAQVIRIERNLTSDRHRNVVLHELLHAIWSTQNLGDEVAEEDAVTELSNGLAAMFEMNPRIRKWFASEFCGVKS